MTQTLKGTDVRQLWSQGLDDVAHTQKRVIVETSGVPVAAIISPMDLERLNRMDEQQEQALDEALKRARAAFAGKTDEQITEEVAEVVDHVRAAKRKETASSTST